MSPRAPSIPPAAVAAALPLWSGTAHAHLVNSGLGPFYDGLGHFGLTVEDLLPVVALALLAGQRGTVAARRALFLLPLAWLAAGSAGLSQPGVAGTTTLAIASFLVLGGLVAAAAPLRPSGVAALAVALGALHGYMNGSAMAEARLGALGLAGIVGGVFVVVALASAAAVAAKAPWARIAVRVAGSWIAAVGLLMFGWAMRPA